MNLPENAEAIDTGEDITIDEEELAREALLAGEALAETVASEPPKPLTRWGRFKAHFEGMEHMKWAFILPVIIMALIYTAMGVFPFGKNSVLVLDLNGQYVYYFEAIRDILLGEQGILYSFERALGGEFLGIVAYYLASPFSIITALFPEGMITEALYVMLLLKCGLSGMNMCVYLHKSHPTKKSSEVIFSVMYALTAYGVVMQHNTMWIDCLLFFPLIMLGVESLIKHGKYKLFVLTLAVSVFSNYYIGYMVCFGVAAYFFVYYFMCTPEERNPDYERAHFIKSLIRVAMYSAVALGMAAMIILPAYYSLKFGKSDFSNPNFGFKQKFDFLDLIVKMFPGSYDTVRPEGLPFVYSGTLTLILLPVFFIIRQISPRKKIAYGALMGFFIFSFNSSTIDLIWHGFQRPNWLNYRYSFMLCFVFIVMAYLAFEHITEIDMRVILWVGLLLGVILVIAQKIGYDNLPDLIGVWYSIICIAAYMILLHGTNRRLFDGAISSILCIFVLLEMFSSGLANVVALDEDVTYSSRVSYRTFMDKWTPAADYINETDKTFYRAEKTKHRKTNDNFALNLKGLSNSTSTLNASQIQFLQDMGYSSRSHWSKYLGGTPLSDSLLGLKYLLAEKDEAVNPLWGEPVYTDEANGTVVYENKYYMSLGYTVGESFENFSMNFEKSPFERMNTMVGLMLGESAPVEIFKPYRTGTPDGGALDTTYVSGHKKYKKKTSGSEARITFKLTPENDYEIFAYFPSDYKRDAELILNGEELSEYFTNETCRIVSLGSHTEGEEITVSLKLSKDDLYLATGEHYFYYLDDELFREVMPRLQSGNYNIESHTDSSFTGTVSATEERSTLLFTIPYDEGWMIYVDGEPCESFKVLDSLTAVKLTPGEHKVELRYAPPMVTLGVITSIISTAVFVLMAASEYVINRRKRAFEGL